MNLDNYIKSIPDYPIEGVLFRDITPLIGSPEAFKETCSRLADFAREVGADVIVGPESRGFIFG
ncbi:MAG: adenine phosphoribosyltransferase, partial [Erysipelotrichaceae bacterium]|nr:adenine phosphoribosyltransferase [Erysipelotrichaceae bacterium]